VLLPRIDIRTLQLAGYDDAHGRIEALRNHGAFIVPDVEQQGTYLCHELFRDFVRHHVSLEGVEAVRNANIRAAHALEIAGDIASALALYAQARDGNSILRILDEHGVALFDGARTDIIAGALDALDVRARAHTMPLALSGLMESAAGRYDQAILQLKKAARRAEDRELRGKILLWTALAAINSWGQSPEQLLCEVESDESVGRVTRGEASALLSVLYARTDRRDDAVAAADRALQVADQANTPQALVRILQRAGVSAAIIGDQKTAETRLARCVELCEQHDLIAFATRTYGWLYIVTWNRGGSVGELQWYAQQEMAMAERSGEMLDLWGAISHSLDVEIRRGSGERVLALERRYTTTIRPKDASGAAPANEAAAWVHAWAGRFEETYRLLSSAWDQFELPLAKALPGSICAIAAAACGRTERTTELTSTVTALLAGVEADQKTHSAPITLLAPRFFCALANAAVGRFVVAKKLLREGTGSDDPAVTALRSLTSHAMVALGEKRPLPDTVAQDALSELTAEGYLGYGKLIVAAMAALSSRVSKESGAVSLTPAEVAVLRRLAEGAAPKAIAEETGRSVYTVQAHVQNAAEKLQAHGRHEVIATARRLGLLND
jgi:DNA-binding CsgD family transcriptional regulator/tetratricopeptide (TPR) repeat protein